MCICIFAFFPWLMFRKIVKMKVFGRVLKYAPACYLALLPMRRERVVLEHCGVSAIPGDDGERLVISWSDSMMNWIPHAVLVCARTPTRQANCQSEARGEEMVEMWFRWNGNRMANYNPVVLSANISSFIHCILLALHLLALQLQLFYVLIVFELFFFYLFFF